MDRALINSIRKGDELVFRQAYDLFHEKLYAYFLQKTKSDDISEELVQLTFIKLWRYRHKLNDSTSAFLATIPHSKNQFDRYTPQPCSQPEPFHFK